jgi:hypothetical protein
MRGGIFSQGAVRFGVVLRTYRSPGGAPLVDVQDEFGGVAAAVLCPALGGLYAPPEPGDQVVLALRPGTRADPVIVGQSFTAWDTLREGDAPGAGQDAPGQATLFAMRIERGPYRVMVDPEAGLSLQVEGPQPLRLQVPADGRIRLSAGGDASGGVVEASALLLALDSMVTRINLLQTQLNDLGAPPLAPLVPPGAELVSAVVQIPSATGGTA